jgi:citrate synthase
VSATAGALAPAAADAAGLPDPDDEAGWDALALEAVSRARADRRFVPGLGHPIHKVTDPRTPVLIAIASEEGLRGPHLRLFEAIGRVHPQVLGRTLPLNGAGTCGAVLADLGLPLDLLRGFALLARAAGLLGQLAEEQRRPLGMDMYLSVDRDAVYVPPESLWQRSQPSSHRRTTPSTTVLRPRRVRTGRRSPTSGSPRSRLFARR